jgi:hypothetical protein
MVLPNFINKKILLVFLMFFIVVIKILAQSDSLFDCIGRTEIYLVRTGSDPKGIQNVKFSDVKSIKIAEQLFGFNYKPRNYYDNMIDKNCTELKYDDGLKLDFVDNPNWLKNFEVTTDKYTLYLKNGGAIKVGMKGEELKAIFPKSYQQRKAYHFDKISGTVSVIVYFCSAHNYMKIYEIAWINIGLSSKNDVIERIFTVTPE